MNFECYNIELNATNTIFDHFEVFRKYFLVHGLIVQVINIVLIMLYNEGYFCQLIYNGEAE